MNCLNSKYIINPRIGELLSMFHCLDMNGSISYYKYKTRGLYEYNKKWLHQMLPVINKENVDKYNVVDQETGMCYPVFLEVKCNHCINCKKEKATQYVKRMQYESYSYPDSKPLFFTLTYNNQSYPETGVSVRDCQLFLKRFRINLIRHGYIQPIRYHMVSEYGSKTHRGHYHGIFWNLPVDDIKHLQRIEEILAKSWNNGFVLSRPVDPCDPATFKYTTKYITKGSRVPHGKVLPFALSSRRHGGIGSRFIDGLKNKLGRVNVKRMVQNPFTGHVEPFCWTKYAIDRLYPSYCRYVPSELRKALQDFELHYKFLDPEVRWLFDTKREEYRKKYSDIVYYGQVSDSDAPIKQYHSQGVTYGHLMDDIKNIDKYKDRDFSEHQIVDQRRSKFLSELFRNMIEPDKHILKINNLRAASRQRATEII